MPKYPFEPKSNAHLMPGQFWGVPLSDGRWACGRVLAVQTEPVRLEGVAASRRYSLETLGATGLQAKTLPERLSLYANVYCVSSDDIL